MSPQEIEELRLKLLLGESLHPEEQERLLGVLGGNVQLREEILEEIRLEGLLRALGQGESSAEGFVRRLEGHLKAQLDATRFIKKVEMRIQESVPPSSPQPPKVPSDLHETDPGCVRPPTRRTRRHPSAVKNPAWGVWALAAAGILAAVTSLGILSSSEPDPGASPKTAEARARAAREAAGKQQAERDRLGRESEEARALAERRRLEAEARLRKPEQSNPLARPKPEPGEDPQSQEKRQKAPADLKRDQARVEEELREAAERAKKFASPEAPAAPQEEKPPVPQNNPASASQGTTQAAIAQVEEVAGDAFRLTKEGKSPLTPGVNLFVADGLQTGAGASRIVLRFPDKTRLELGPDTVLTELATESGKHLTLSQGTVRAVVAKQPKDQPMIIRTLQGQAKVVGTTLRIIFDPDPKKGTRLEVEEGKVELRNLPGKTVLVESGHYAIAAEGVELVSKVLPVEEIFLTYRQAKLVGGDWILAKDRTAPAGSVLSSPETTYRPRKTGGPSSYDSVKNRPTYALFTFFAEGGKDYKVWIRGKSLPEDPAHVKTAEVAIEVPDAQLTPQDGQIALAADHAFDFTGFFRYKGYVWIGGAEEFPDQLKVGDVPVVIRFPRSGLQTLKLHALTSPAWVDAIWISATQRTRPDADVIGPSGR